MISLFAYIRKSEIKGVRKVYQIASAAVVVTLLFPSLSMADDWYWGYGILSSDFSDFTVEDAEASSLTFEKRDQEPTGYSVFMGKPVSSNVNFELAYEYFGKSKALGRFSTASLNSTAESFGITPSFLIKLGEAYGDLTPFARFGFVFGQSNERTKKQGGIGLIANPYDTSQNEIGASLVYGLGADYRVTKNSALRLDWKIYKDGQTDFIDNIDNGYIKRDFETTGISLVHNYNENGRDLNTKSRYSVGIFFGTSVSGARMSDGSYSGSVYNLTTGNVVSTVSGGLSDDKSDNSKRIAIFYPINEFYELEAQAVNYGTFKSRSTNLGVTGGGNALTAAATRSTNSLTASLSRPINISDNFKISPSIGFGVFYTEDEIYNNLDFRGVGGSARGPQSTSTNINVVFGLMARLKVNNSFDVGIRYDYAHDVGHRSGLGEGRLTSISAGLIANF